MYQLTHCYSIHFIIVHPISQPIVHVNSMPVNRGWGIETPQNHRNRPPIGPREKAEKTVEGTRNTLLNLRDRYAKIRPKISHKKDGISAENQPKNTSE